MMQNTYSHGIPQGPREYSQMWHQNMQQQLQHYQMRPDSQQMYGSYRSGGSPQTPRSANMSSSVSTQGMMPEMEPVINFVDPQSPRGMFSQPYQQSTSTPSTVRSVNRESSESHAANVALTGIGSLESPNRRMNRAMFGDYITEAQDDKMYGSLMPRSAMTAQVSQAQGHIAMTATIVKEQTPAVTMLAQTGGNSHDSQNFFAQTQPETSEISTQTETQIEDTSANVQQSMNFRGRFEEGQEHIGVQCDMHEIEKLEAHDEAIEMEIYANVLWQELQQVADQDRLLDGQEQMEDQHTEAEMNSGLGQNQHPSTRFVYVDDEFSLNDVQQAQQEIRSVEDVHWPSDDSGESQVGYIPGLMLDEAYDELGVVYKSQWLGSDGYPRDPKGPMKESSINDSSELMSNLKVGTLENWSGNSYSPCEQQQVGWSMPQSFSDTEHMTGVEKKALQSRLGALMFNQTWRRDNRDIEQAKTGGRQIEQDEPNMSEYQIEEDKVIEAYVQHRQEQTAQVHTSRKGDESNSEEDQDHNYRHGAEYWESVD